eukprot:7206807-Prymnesium_polylepis.3
MAAASAPSAAVARPGRPLAGAVRAASSAPCSGRRPARDSRATSLGRAEVSALSPATGGMNSYPGRRRRVSSVGAYTRVPRPSARNSHTHIGGSAGELAAWR